MLNPLTAEIGALNDESLTALIRLMKAKVAQYGGVQPHIVNTTHSFIDYGHGCREANEVLLVVWQNAQVTERSISILEKTVKEISEPEAVTTRRDVYNQPIRPRDYHSLMDRECSTVIGYIFSEDPRKNIGTWITRRFPSMHKKKEALRKERGRWLYSGDRSIEARLRTAKTTNLTALEYVVRVSMGLTEREPEDQKALIYDLYRSLLQESVERKRLDELAGLDEIVEFMRWNMFGGTALPAGVAYGLKNRAVLLAGVYGVGKTSIAKVLTTEDSGTLVVPIESNILVGALGEQRDTFNSLFGSVGRLQRRTGIHVTLFCEDIEAAMMSHEENGGNPEYSTKVSGLLNEMQGIGGKNTNLSGSTNNPPIIDPRFLQFGRIGYIVHISLPNDGQRKRTFEIYMANQPSEGINMDVLVQRTQGFNNRAIEEICYQAAQSSLRRAALKTRKSGEPLYEAARRVDPASRKDFKINEADMTAAFDIVRGQTDVKRLVQLDRDIGEFCRTYNKRIGF